MHVRWDSAELEPHRDEGQCGGPGQLLMCCPQQVQNHTGYKTFFRQVFVLVFGLSPLVRRLCRGGMAEARVKLTFSDPGAGAATRRQLLLLVGGGAAASLLCVALALLLCCCR